MADDVEEVSTRKLTEQGVKPVKLKIRRFSHAGGGSRIVECHDWRYGNSTVEVYETKDGKLQFVGFHQNVESVEEVE